MEEIKTGFVAIIGRPNVGKSSLVNKLVGTKVSIIGPKPQTTRNKILGIYNSKGYQIVFVDTPGTIQPKTKLDEFMRRSIDVSIEGNDALVIVLDATRIDKPDFELIESFSNITIPLFIVINKNDIGKYEKVYPQLAKLNEYKFVTDFVSVSARTGKNIDVLLEKLKQVMPVGHPHFGADDITDKSERFMAAEILREKALIFLQEEIPHGIASYVTQFKDKGKIINIDAEIVASKENHKLIIIGKNGLMLKNIATSARLEMEKLFGKKINLKIFVKVRKGWQDNTQNLRDFGYDKRNI